MLTILPLPCRFMTGTTARQQRKVPVRLTFSTLSKASRVICSIGVCLRMPAQFTSTSIAPNFATAASTAACTSASEVTSTFRPITLLRDVSRLPANFSTASPFTSQRASR